MQKQKKTKRNNNLKNNCLYSFEGKRVGCSYEHYKSYEGEYPQWAKESLAKLEE